MTKKITKSLKSYYNVIKRDLSTEFFDVTKVVSIRGLKADSSAEVRRYIFNLFKDKAADFSIESNNIVFTLKFRRRDFNDLLNKYILESYHLAEVASAFHNLCNTDKTLFVTMSPTCVTVMIANPSISIKKELSRRLSEVNEGEMTIQDYLKEKLYSLQDKSLIIENIMKSTPYMDKKFTESDLEDIIAEDLSVIEEGMTLIDRQYYINNGTIDILARDKNGVKCIIELKVVPGDRSIVYQSVYYPTEFDELTRMITVAPNYSRNILNSLNSLKHVEKKVYYFSKTNNDDDYQISIIDYDDYLSIRERVENRLQEKLKV